MRTTLTALAVALLLASGGCADSDSDGEGALPQDTPAGDTSTSTEPTDGTPTDETPPGDTQTPPEGLTAVRVTYSRSGGIIGGEQASHTFVRGAAPPVGFSRAEQQDVLEAAADPALRDLPPVKAPKETCCDLFTYEVSVTWADGESRTFTTVDGQQVAPALDTLLQVAAG